MIGAELFSAPVQAAFVVGVILVQAVVLYAGYGVLERVASPVIELVTGA